MLTADGCRKDYRMKKDLNDICLIIQARLSSERLPKKMLLPFSDTNIMDIALEKITHIKAIDWKKSFYLSAYEPELKNVAEKYGLQVFHRSRESAFSEGNPMGEMYEWHDKLGFKYCILINACAPFLKPETIDSFINSFANSESEGMFGVMKKKNYFWNKGGELVTPWPAGQDCLNTKEVEETLEAAHCLYAGRLDTIKDGVWMGDFNSPGDIELFPMEEFECHDIDYPWEFKMCESIYLSNQREKPK